MISELERQEIIYILKDVIFHVESCVDDCRDLLIIGLISYITSEFRKYSYEKSQE